ncbi:hypothetical protein H1C71_040534 [Ictidomys tridecemlineatus]|uniref:Beta-defensin 103-like n=1 Tax=Ictidomys tridecemlineatus TaxID=43179 RepID=A0A287DET8_ICTTR|nr:hypothetical protein H1C71_040534 [Ictidomys tridecemlineatus]
MRILYLLGVLLLLFLMPLPGGGRCAMLGCLSKEEQIGRCSLRGRKCCRKKK